MKGSISIDKKNATIEKATIHINETKPHTPQYQTDDTQINK